MIVHVVRRLEELAPDAAHWNELLERSCSNSVFLTWEWIDLWWQVFGRGLTATVLVAEEDGRWIGVAPLMAAPHPAPGGRHLRTLKYIGQGGDTLAEHLDFIAEPGREPAVAAAFADQLCGPLRRDWDALLLERTVASSPHAAPFAERLHGHGIAIVRRNEWPSPYLLLPDSMDALLAAKSSNFRYQYQRSRKRLNALADVRLLRAGRDLPVEEAIGVLAELNRARWQEAGESFRTDDYRRFHTALAKRFEKRGWLWLAVLIVGGEPIAARYDFAYGGKVWCIQGGWKPARQELNPGTLLTGEVIAWAIAQGLREYDFLGGEDHYKRRWADRERTLADFEAFNPATLRGRWWPRLRSFKRAVSTATP
jgi:CelD/BcsL family acetyltransferase involved in cellulose biosynthesis